MAPFTGSAGKCGRGRVHRANLSFVLNSRADRRHLTVPFPGAFSMSGTTQTAEEQRNLAIATEMYRKVLLTLDSTHVDRYFAPDYIQHGSLAEDGREALKRFLDKARSEMPG